MESNKGRIFFSKSCSTLVLRFVGFIQYSISPSLDKFIDTVIASNSFESVILDLSDLSYIDSTNLGLITKLATFMESKNNKKVTIFSPNEPISQVLMLLGFDKIFKVIENRPIIKAEFTEIQSIECSDDLTIASVMLSAHSNLIDINEDNKHKFIDVVDSLKIDIKSMEKP